MCPLQICLCELAGPFHGTLGGTSLTSACASSVGSSLVRAAYSTSTLLRSRPGRHLRNLILLLEVTVQAAIEEPPSGRHEAAQRPDDDRRLPPRHPARPRLAACRRRMGFAPLPPAPVAPIVPSCLPKPKRMADVFLTLLCCLPCKCSTCTDCCACRQPTCARRNSRSEAMPVQCKH
jgi:hypothetical protein